ncbi:hypothetical protein M8J76_011942 [Diaphorina citri]|nr:hypothetical protein M8J76_011942 [Diaphorina citri]
METCQAWPCDPCSSRSTRIGCRLGAWTEEFLDHKKLILSAAAEEEKEKEKEAEEDEEEEEEKEEDRKNKKRAFLESIQNLLEITTSR